MYSSPAARINPFMYSVSLEQHGMTRGDLAPLMGGRARVSEFFSGRRRLSIAQVRSLRDALGIPADLLVE